MRQFFLGLVLVLILGWLGWKEVKHQGANWLPVKYVRIGGAFQYMEKDTIKKVLQEQVKNGLYNTDIQGIKASVKQLPWAEKVEVERIWPDTIDIKIVEQIPIARWRVKGLLNKDGELFTPSNISEFKQLPLISGPVGNAKKLLKIIQGLQLALSDKKMELTEFYVNDRRSWKLILKNGLELNLGRIRPLDKFNRFLRTLEIVGEEIVAKIAIVDLRYPNGYALTWKQGEKKINWNKKSKQTKT